MFGGVGCQAESERLTPDHWSFGRRCGGGAGFACLVGLGARLSPSAYRRTTGLLADAPDVEPVLHVWWG